MLRRLRLSTSMRLPGSAACGSAGLLVVLKTDFIMSVIWREDAAIDIQQLDIINGGSLGGGDSDND